MDEAAPRNSPFVIIWRFEPKPNHQSDFERAYASGGLWAKLFERAEGYLGTQLLRDQTHESAFLTLDQWQTQAHYENFKQMWKKEYEALDRELEGLTASETFIGSYSEVPRTRSYNMKGTGEQPSAFPPAVQLRAVEESDLSIFYRQQLDSEANRMAAFTRKDPADEKGFYQHWRKLITNPAVVMRTILLDGEVVGSIAKYEMLGQSQVTYWIGKRFWGKGIATRALREFLRLLPTRPLFARTAHDNLASGRVLEKCGFKKTASERSFANARGHEIVEWIWRLDDYVE